MPFCSLCGKSFKKKMRYQRLCPNCLKKRAPLLYKHHYILHKKRK